MYRKTPKVSPELNFLKNYFAVFFRWGFCFGEGGLYMDKNLGFKKASLSGFQGIGNSFEVLC